MTNSSGHHPPAETSKPRIGVDARTFDYSDSNSRGIGHYALHHLLVVGGLRPDWQFILFNDSGKAKPAMNRLLELPNFSVASLDDPAATVPDLLHIPDPMNLSTGFDSPMRLFPSLSGTATFHDITPLRYYWQSWPAVNQHAYQTRLNQLCSRPFHLLANSEFTKQDLIQCTGIAEARVTTVLAGLNRPANVLPDDPSLAPSVRRKYDIKRPFFLHVGALDPHKNFASVIKAFTQLPRGSANLVVVGQKEGFLKHIADHFAQIKMQDVIFTDFIPRADLEVLYHEALCLLFLSRYEGFGFPVLEAMAHGCPVITTNVTSLPEVAGPAALQFAPDDVAGVAKAMRSLACSLIKREGMRSQGLLQAAKFTWGDVARKTISVWENILQGKVNPLGSEVKSPVAAAPESVVTSRVADAANKLPNLDARVVWLAPWKNPSGFCSEAFAFAKGLTRHLQMEFVNIARHQSSEFVAGLPADYQQLLKNYLRQSPNPAGKVVVIHGPGYALEPVSGASVNIGRTMFETDSVPAGWIARCNQMDAVWVPSQFNLETFSAAGVQREKLRVVPETVDEDLFDPATVCPMKLVQPAAYNFLAVFEFIRRKGWDVLLRAYLTEFAADDDVCLHLRCYLANDSDGKQSKELREKLDAFAQTLNLDSACLPRIELLGMPLATRDLPSLYAAVDCLVAPSRGEGWGRPQHEAMMMGLPVIATNWSGNTEFMTPETACLLDYELVKVEATDPGFEHYLGHRWAEPSCAHLRQWLRRLQQNPAVGKAIGVRARAHVLKHFSIGSGTQTALRALAECNSAVSGKDVVSKTSSIGSDRKPAVLINWIGSFLDHGSLSHVNRELVGALKNISGLKIQAVTNGSLTASDAAKHWPELTREISTVPAPASALTVRHAWPPNWLRPASGKLVVIQPWEFGSLPEDWVQRARDVDEFWLPSEYVRQVYIASGVPAKKVFVVPNGVDPEKFHPQVAPMELATQKKFKFLFVGGTIGRKGPDLLLQAYLKNFTAADDVCLVIKDFGGQGVYTGQTFEAQIRAAQAIPSAPEILYLNEELPPESLPGLYAACDCFVLPYRGEGFGLPVLEAMACGLPVVVTAGGATDDFVRDEFAYHIPAVKIVFGHEAGGLKLVHPGWLLEPDLAALGEQMRHVFENPAEARERGQLASRHAHQFFSWKKSAAIVQQRIGKLVGNQYLPGQTWRSPVKLPAVAHLGRLDEARELFARNEFQAAWESTRTAMAKRPFHPEAVFLLAEIALAAGNGKVAKLCAQRARDLAPGWQAPKQFLAKPLKGDAKLDWLVPQGSTGSRLSICLIVKNEEGFLAQCLKSVRGLAAQVIVVDTGSTDRTVEIAREFGAEIYSSAWCDDFAVARNAALEHATGDWVLVLDADEELPPTRHAALLADLKKSGTLAYRLPLVNAGQNDGRSFVPRLFRNAPGVYYSGRIHEQVFSSLLPHCKSWGLKTALGTAEILHHGYTKEMVRDRNKIERNLKLLRLATEENPTDVNLVMNLGLELVRSDDLAGGVEKYREAFQMMSAQPAGELVPELREALLTQFTSQLYKIRAHAEVLEILHSPLARQGGLTASLHLALGLAQFELKQFSEAADQMRQCLSKRAQPTLSPINTDIHTAAPQHCLALSLAKLGDTAGAEKAFQAALAEPGVQENPRLDFAKCLSAQNRFVDALRQLHEIVAQNPRQAAAWRLGGEIALGRPELLAFAREWTDEAARALPEDSVLAGQRAEALLLNGATAAALELWEKIWSRDRSSRALAALILCEAVESPTTHAPDEGADEQAASRAFIEWYQKLIAMRSPALVTRVNEQLEKLARALPTAAQMLEAALKEAETPAEV